MKKIVGVPDTVFAEAAAEVAALVTRKPDAVLGFTAVDVPEAFFTALRDSGVSLERATVFNICEFSGNAASGAQSQAARLNKLLYDAARPGAVHVPGPDADFDAAIRAAGGLDLVVLGLGARGHVAFDEPGVDFSAGTHENKLADATRASLEPAFGGLDSVPTHGVTMGIATILAAKRVLLLAAGEDKANAAQKTLEGRPETYIPASFLQLHTDVTVYLDAAAAASMT